jgi:glutaconate CoA-transferase subunit B
VRFPGSFGSAFMYFMAHRTILFREEHSPRVLVERVANISAPGTSAPDVFRPRPCQALVTGRCVFDFLPEAGRFRLASTHPGETVGGIRAATGFSFDVPDQVPETAAPTDAELALLRGPVCDEMTETYPGVLRPGLRKETSRMSEAQPGPSPVRLPGCAWWTLPASSAAPTAP